MKERHNYSKKVKETWEQKKDVKVKQQEMLECHKMLSI